MTRLLILLFAIAIAGHPAHAASERSVALLARDLLLGIDRAPMGSLPTASGYGAPRIAVHTVDAHGNADDRSRAMTRRVLTALQQEAQGRYRFIAVDSLDKIISAIKAEHLSEDETQARIRDLRINARADILIAGIYHQEGGGERVSYQTVSADSGELLVSAEATVRSAIPSRAEAQRPASGRYRPTVEEAERQLFDKGYDPGPVDGYMTRKTRDALRAYQLDSALPVNGRLTRRVVKNLRRDSRSNLL